MLWMTGISRPGVGCLGRADEIRERAEPGRLERSAVCNRSILNGAQ